MPKEFNKSFIFIHIVWFRAFALKKALNVQYTKWVFTWLTNENDIEFYVLESKKTSIKRLQK